MKAPGTLLFFHPMFRDPEPFGRQVDHLPSLRQVCWLGAQVVVAMLAAENWMNEHLIGRLHLPQVMATMTPLPASCLPALCAQALGRTNKTIGGGRQTAIMAIFGLLPFEGFDALLLRGNQPFKGFDALLLSLKGQDRLLEPFTQGLIGLLGLKQFFVFASQGFKQGSLLGSELVEFFIRRHAPILPDLHVVPQLHSPSE
jgi:hypothetical protein